MAVDDFQLRVLKKQAEEELIGMVKADDLMGSVWSPLMVGRWALRSSSKRWLSDWRLPANVVVMVGSVGRWAGIEC